MGLAGLIGRAGDAFGGAFLSRWLILNPDPARRLQPAPAWSPVWSLPFTWPSRS
jgi:hypothetical protein